MRLATLTLVALLAFDLPGAATDGAVGPLGPGASADAADTIDRVVMGRLRQIGVTPAPVSTDEVFVRRVYLDVIGTLPTASEARAFLGDRRTGKRRLLIDALLEREEFADYWAMKWSDVLRVKSEFPINLWPNAVQAYHQWIRSAIRDNVPYDRFARALLTESGSNFRAPPVNFYRAVQSREPQALAQAVALTFLGARADRWPADRLAGFSEFFAQIGYKPTAEWKEEIVYFDPRKGGGRPRTAVLPDGTPVRLEPGRDPREVFTAWLTAPGNPWFARAAANRVWFWLVGRGVIHEPDDIRADNPPSHPDLMALLERELVGSRYDLRHLYRVILNSDTYQRSAVPPPAGPDADASFASYLVRPIEAEVLADALCQITGTSEQYSSAIPEPYTFMPAGQRAIALADGSISSTLLDTFGRSPRDTGLLLERSRPPGAAERLYLLNSSHIQTKLGQSRALQAMFAPRADLRGGVVELYLAVLSRPPSGDELRVAIEHVQSAPTRRAGALDLAWALVNTLEFLYRH